MEKKKKGKLINYLMRGNIRLLILLCFMLYVVLLSYGNGLLYNCNIIQDPAPRNGEFGSRWDEAHLNKIEIKTKNGYNNLLKEKTCFRVCKLDYGQIVP